MLKTISKCAFSSLRYLAFNNNNGTRTLAAVATPSHISESAIASSENKLQQDKLYSRLEIEVKGADPAVVKSYSWFATTAAGHLGIDIGKCWASRKSYKQRKILLKSVHIYKKHRVQYEVRTNFQFMHFHNLTGSTLDTFLEYIERNIPEGVALKATKIEIQEIPEHLRTSPSTTPAS